MPHLPLYNDKELLLRLSQGDEQAFHVLFEQYRDFVFSFAHRMTESDALSKDTVQEIFIKIWLNRASLSEIRSFPAYINRLTRNQVLNGMKRRAHEVALLKEVYPAEERNTTEEYVLKKELESLIGAAIQQLPGQQQKVYRMSRIEGLTHEQIATALNISRETVKKHLMVALRSVQEYLRVHGGLTGILATCLAEWYH